MITVVGEALLDLIAESGAQAFASRPGGSPANVAVALARLGAQVTLATQLGDDLPGRIVGKYLRANDVVVQRLPAQSSATSLALAALDNDGGATYDFRITWDITEPPRILPDCLCLHTGSIATALYPGADIVEDLMRNQRKSGAVTISLDPNIRPSLLGSIEGECARVERQVGLADIVKVSAEDLRWLYPDADPRTVARDWLARGPALVVVTLGADGAYALTRQFAATRVAPQVTVVDTVGAGDAFTAGLLNALGGAGLLGGARREQLAAITRSGLGEVLDFAIAVATATCGSRGADPPRWRWAGNRHLG
ncbi:carbohydrate kinase family protein [Nocardia pseudovaccinii]|uniref:carbohydrate kinase family protein n=1 Tax=Nocardia pseudovaccinii TaxID=189540 RepID=UPI0007A4D6AC|nr:carbohydrate kinase [Nocardia pseudovaccinii]